MAIAWAVLTVSSEPQLGSLKNQKLWAEGVATAKGWRLTRIVEGVATGRNGPRSICRDILLEIRASELEARPDYLLMIRLDRIGRGSIVDSQIFVRDLLALGCRVYTRDAGEIRLDSAMDELIAAVQMAVARHENDVRSEKARATHKRRVASGEPLTNRAAYGLLIDPIPRRHYVADPKYRDVIEQIFAKRIAGVRVSAIAHWLIDASEPQTYKNGRVYEPHWTETRVGRLIQNRAYVVVVGEETWLHAQRVYKYIGKSVANERKHGPFPLGGLIRCECGQRLIAQARNIERSRQRGVPPSRFYTCTAIWNHEKKRAYHQARDVEERFEALLRQLSKNPEAHLGLRSRGPWGMTIAKIDAKVVALRLKLDKLEHSRSRVWKLDDSGLIESSETARRLEEINERRLELQSLLVAELEERKLAEKTVRLECDTEQLCLKAWDRFREASVPGQIAIAREVSSSLGGLRVRINGTLITGRGKDSPPYERALNPAERKKRRRGYAGRYLPRFELSPEQYAREWEIIDGES